MRRGEKLVSDELFNRVTEGHLLDIICKGLAKIKENQIVGCAIARNHTKSEALGERARSNDQKRGLILSKTDQSLHN